MDRRYSLRGRAMFACLYRHGKTIREGGLSLRYFRQSVDLPRFAFSATRDVGNAVSRNRLRRLFQEALRLELAAWEPGLYHFRFVDMDAHFDRAAAAATLKRLRSMLNG